MHNDSLWTLLCFFKALIKKKKVLLKERKKQFFYFFILITHSIKSLFTPLERQCVIVTSNALLRACFFWVNTIQISIWICETEKIKSRSCMFLLSFFFQVQINHTWPMGSPALWAASAQKTRTWLIDSAAQINTKQVPLFRRAVGIGPQRLFEDVECLLLPHFIFLSACPSFFLELYGE